MDLNGSKVTAYDLEQQLYDAHEQAKFGKKKRFVGMK